MWGPTPILAQIGSAVLTFIGYKQTNKHPASKVYLYDILKIAKAWNKLYDMIQYILLKVVDEFLIHTYVLCKEDFHRQKYNVVTEGHRLEVDF